MVSLTIHGSLYDEVRQANYCCYQLHALWADSGSRVLNAHGRLYNLTGRGQNGSYYSRENYCLREKQI
jgi:hypothetical protein